MNDERGTPQRPKRPWPVLALMVLGAWALCSCATLPAPQPPPALSSGATAAAITAAKHRVQLESYIFEDTGIAAEIGRLLIAKAEQGVSVALRYDTVGSIGSDPLFFDALGARCVLVCAFDPVNPVQRLGYWGINHRNHRKVLVTDGEVAFAGGFNISQVNSSGSGGSGSKGSSLFGTELLSAGVEIHELAHAVLHAKTAVIDGVFSTVGSSNMDWRSFADSKTFADRPWKDRVMEQLGGAAERWL